MQKLRNRRTCGHDQIFAELVKYGGEETAQQIATLYNSIFEQHKHLDAIGQGVLLPLNKPGKPKTVDNTRAITLLNIIRKLLSIAVLNRIYPDIDKYLTPAQSGFRRNRSTADVVWSYRWIDAIAKRNATNFNIMGIDMSKAFDSIHREKIIETLEEAIPDESNKRILRYLLSNTTLQPKINGTLGKQFKTVLGTPQGDSLSPVLFTIYLEGAMRAFRTQAHYKISEKILDTCYADDVDFVNTSRAENANTLDTISELFPQYGLIVNAGKTEFIDISKDSKSDVRKLGSRIDSDADIKHRISAGNAAFKKLRDLWTRKKYVQIDTKIKL